MLSASLNKTFPSFLKAAVTYLRHHLAIGPWVEGRFREEYGLILRVDSQLAVVGVAPDPLHVVPVGDDSVLNGVPQAENAANTLGVVTHIVVLFSCSNHHRLEISK